MIELLLNRVIIRIKVRYVQFNLTENFQVIVLFAILEIVVENGARIEIRRKLEKHFCVIEFAYDTGYSANF